MLTFLSWLFGYVEKRLKVKLHSKTYDVTEWTTNNYNTHITNISRSKDSQTITFDQLIEYNVRNIFLQKSGRKWGRETSSRTLFVKKKIKTTGQYLRSFLRYFGRPLLGYIIKTNFITFHAVSLEICLIFIFYKRVWD